MIGGKAPLIEWCDIPTGHVNIESIIYHVRPFKISRFPITFDQFQAFLDTPDGYANQRWWTGFPAREYERDVKAPHWPIDKHPREQVSWYEARAYCRWLSHQTGQSITLPTEQQWMRAAQGDDARGFPWGPYYDSNRYANSRERALMRTTPVDEHPRGVSPYGVMDMAGNVWEWCLNLYENSSKIGLHEPGARVLRGGSWFSRHDVMHLSFRYFALPRARDRDIGFRVVQYPNHRSDYVRPDLIYNTLHQLNIVRGRIRKRLNAAFGP